MKLLIILFALTAFAQKPETSRAPAQAGTISLAPSAWGLIQDGSPAMVITANTAGPGIQVPFPTYDGVNKHSINYLTTSTNLSKPTLAIVTAEITVDAQPATTFQSVFSVYDCAGPATVRLYFADVAGRGKKNPSGRWWANTSTYTGHYALQGGLTSVVLSVPLDPAQWSNVNGQSGAIATGEFANAIASIGEVGVTFGGCFFGHGVGVQGGAATLKITRYEVQ